MLARSLEHIILLNQRESPDQGDIVGREYIISSFMPPYGILLADSTILVLFRSKRSFCDLRSHFEAALKKI
jgi:hypothetical protein